MANGLFLIFLHYFLCMTCLGGEVLDFSQVDVIAASSLERCTSINLNLKPEDVISEFSLANSRAGLICQFHGFHHAVSHTTRISDVTGVYWIYESASAPVEEVCKIGKKINFQDPGTGQVISLGEKMDPTKADAKNFTRRIISEDVSHKLFETIECD